MLTKRQQRVRQFRAEHHSIFLLIVQLQTLEEILVASLFLVLFALTEDWQELVQFQFLLALLLRAAQLLDSGVRGVQVQRAEDIADVHRVDDIGAIVIVNGEGEFRPFSTESILSHYIYIRRMLLANMRICSFTMQSLI
jgi:hypothetical protein